MGRKKRRAKSSTIKREEILLHPPTGIRKRSAYGQLIVNNDLRKSIKRSVLSNKSKLTKHQKKLLQHIKKYKSGVVRKYNKALVSSMKKKGYFKFQIKHAKEYSYVGKKVRIELDKIVLTKWNYNVTKGYVNGKWRTAKQIDSLIKRRVKAARIKSYQEILGVTKKEAKSILGLIEKKSPAALKYIALIY